MFGVLLAAVLLGLLAALGIALRRRRAARSSTDTGAVLHALLGPLGTARRSLDGSGSGTLIGMAQGWRIPGGPVHRQALRLQWPGLSRAELDAHRVGIAPWSVVRLRVDALPPAVDLGATDMPTVDGAGLAVVEDADLSELARLLQQPVVLDDPRFGRLTLARSLGCFEAATTWDGDPVQLSIPATGEALSGARTTAAALFAEPGAWRERVRACAVAQLLPLKNHTWRDEDEDGQLEPPLTAPDVASRLTLARIDVREGGGFSVWFDDGGLFFGHAIEVRGTLDGGCETASIMG